MADDAQTETPSRTIGEHYAVLAHLGSGGAADVYRVRDLRSGELLALKRLRKARPDRELLALTLFEREYYTLRQLDHPGVIRVGDYGVDQDGAYYTMELLEGTELLALGRLPWRDACRVLRDVASALAMLHARRWLHRDLSPRNVFVTREHAAKLIDFGAMAPMGVCKSTVGTPPLVPPEAVQQQTLDGQADLYSLGALAYFMLTGRHAFPARSFDELRDLWRTVLLAPDQIATDVPAELSRLVLELMSLDRFARPASAAAVIERLDALLGPAEGAPVEPAAVGRAYLATPKLIGRDHDLSRVRERMVHSLRGRGAVVLLEGEPGSGRSRLLDACVLEARLLGAGVLRADASDATRGDYGVVTALSEQLLELAPVLARDAARLRRHELASVIPSLRDDSGGEPTAPSERRHVQTALRDWFRAIARRKRIVIAIDDLDCIDELSLALLAALAHKSERRKVVLCASVRRGAPPAPALELLREVAMRIEVTPLSPAQTETLLESVFGSSPNTAALAQRAHELSQGNPRGIMALADHLVQRGYARYAAGSWSLPAKLDPRQLPASIESALASRIADLDPAAHALAETLALTEPRAMALSDYGALCDADDRARAFGSVEALVEAGILAPEGDRYRFTHAGWSEWLRDRLPVERARELHARLGRVLSASADPLRATYHYFESGQQREALALLLAKRDALSSLHSEAGVLLLERAVRCADELALPPRDRLELRVGVVEASSALGLRDVFARFARETLQRLKDASGLTDLEQLDPQLPASERLKLGLTQAQARYDALPEAERAFSPAQALSRIARVELAFSSMAGSALELEWLDGLPALAPLSALAPSLELVDKTTAACRDHLEGRFVTSRAVFLDVLQRLAAPDRMGMNEGAWQRARLNAQYAIGILEAVIGSDSLIERVSELERHPGYRVNAWRLRMLYHASRGDLEEARVCERRAQLFLLQDGARPFPATDLQAEAATRFISDDLDGLRQMLPRLEEAAASFPARRALHELAQCHYLRVKGDPSAALQRLQPLLEVSSPENSVRFAWIGGTHLMLLNALGRYGEAAVVGESYLRASRARGLDLVDCSAFVRPLCEALAHENPERAAELSEALIAAFESVDASGLLLGSCYEVSARIALIRRCAEDFERWAARCQAEYQRAHNPALAMKLARLQREALAAHVARGPISSKPPRPDVDMLPEQPAQGTVLSRIAECVDASERARCALALLIEETGAEGGHLYGWLTGRLLHLASIPDEPPPAELAECLHGFVEAELRAIDTTAEGGAPLPESQEAATPLPHLQPALLATMREGEPAIAAAAMLSLREGRSRRPSRELLSTLAQSLLDHDDLDALIRAS